MSTTTIIAELLVIGFLVLASITFITLSIFKVDNFNFFSQIKDFSGVLILVVTILSYFLGALFNQLAFSGYWYFASLIQRAFNTRNLRFFLSNSRVKYFVETGRIRRKEIREEIDVQNFLFFILENGSSSTIERIKYLQSLQRLFKSTTLIIPLVGISSTTWLISSFNNWKAGSVSLLICCLLFVLSRTALHTIDNSYVGELKAANEAILARLSLEK